MSRWGTSCRYVSANGRECQRVAVMHVRLTGLATNGNDAESAMADMTDLCRTHAAMAVQRGDADQTHMLSLDCTLSYTMWNIRQNGCALDDSAPDPFEGWVLR